MLFSRIVLGKEGFSKWPWKGVGFLFGKILKFSRIDRMLCGIKHDLCYVCSFYYL